MNGSPSSDPGGLSGEKHGRTKRRSGCFSRCRLKRGGWQALFTLIGVLVGFALGIALYFVRVSPMALMWIGLPGELYMRMLKGAVLPLVITSIISGTAGLNPKENGRVGIVGLGFIVGTNVLGAILGLILAIIIKPGSMDASFTDSSATVDTGHMQTSDIFADLIRNLVPSNIVTDCFQKTQTKYKPVTVVVSNDDANNTNATTTTTVYEPYLGTAGGTNVLGLVIACSAIGMAAAHGGDAAKPFVTFFKASGDVIFILVNWILVFMPLGAASLIAKAVGGTPDIGNTVQGVGMYVLAQAIIYVLYSCFLLPLAFFIILRQNPLAFVMTVGRPVITALVTVSSALSMPDILKSVESRQGVDPRFSRFLAPLAVSINRDGSAMFIAITCIYIAQINGGTTAGSLVVIGILTAVGSLAIPSVHSASIVTILMILASLDIPPANIGIILALEWLSDRIRTGVNVASGVLCCVFTWHFCKSSLLLEAPEEKQEKMKNNPLDNVHGFNAGKSITVDILAETRNGGAGAGGCGDGGGGGVSDNGIVELSPMLGGSESEQA